MVVLKLILVCLMLSAVNCKLIAVTPAVTLSVDTIPTIPTTRLIAVTPGVKLSTDIIPRGWSLYKI